MLSLISATLLLIVTVQALSLGWGVGNKLPLPTLDLGRPPTRCSVNIGGKVAVGQEVDGACRYTLRYGDAARWEPSTASSSFGNLTNGIPPSCPQVGGYATGSSQSEDCLYATVYTPINVQPIASLPVFVWIHGGSFTSGSASAPGLVGWKLATEGNIIVIVLQYRLGVLGYLLPASASTISEPNLGVGDVVVALRMIRTNVRDLGGDGGRVVLGGQSSGAHMIRALLAAPAARGYFRGAILQSDPMFYGLASKTISQQLTNAFYALQPLSACRDLACLKALSVDRLLEAQSQLIQTAPFSIPGVPLGEPIRPTFGYPSIPVDPSAQLFASPSRLSSPPNQLPLLVTSTSNEAGQIVQSLFPSPVPPSNDTLLSTLSLLIGPDRAKTIVDSGAYPLGSGADTFRETFERIVTDGVWRCLSQAFGKEWAKNGGRVWVGEWTKGVTYESNKGGEYCSQKGRVCHEDDIYPTFGIGDNTLVKEVTAAWISFIKNLDPDTPQSRGVAGPWRPFSATSTARDIRPIGAGQVRDCPPRLWGGKIKNDWQLYI